MVKGKGHVIYLLKHTTMTARELELMFNKLVIKTPDGPSEPCWTRWQRWK